MSANRACSHTRIFTERFITMRKNKNIHRNFMDTFMNTEKKRVTVQYYL